ncbi:uncharacterized protein BJ171DRAFT_638325, partial [Polychytrium aggregatum]|uniref:uncharacterized protein n=1 Tax=Polychytrium aggregatum TaxID=110093 RepID=UPI0022FEF533
RCAHPCRAYERTLGLFHDRLWNVQDHQRRSLPLQRPHSILTITRGTMTTPNDTPPTSILSTHRVLFWSLGGAALVLLVLVASILCIRVRRRSRSSKCAQPVETLDVQHQAASRTPARPAPDNPDTLLRVVTIDSSIDSGLLDSPVIAAADATPNDAAATGLPWPALSPLIMITPPGPTEHDSHSLNDSVAARAGSELAPPASEQPIASTSDSDPDQATICDWSELRTSLLMNGSSISVPSSLDSQMTIARRALPAVL